MIYLNDNKINKTNHPPANDCILGHTKNSESATGNHVILYLVIMSNCDVKHRRHNFLE